MKILFHMGNIHFQDFGGRNFVIPDKSEGEMVLVTLQAVVAAEQSAQADAKACAPGKHKLFRSEEIWQFCPNCGQRL